MSHPISRRQALLGMVGLGGTITSALVPSAAAEEHPAHPVAAPDAVSMLYDNTLCTGCKACMPACNEANGLPADSLLSGGLWDMPTDLNSKTKNIIKLYQEPDGPGFAFVNDSACTVSIPPALPDARSEP